MKGITKTRWQAASPLLDELLDADATTRSARLAQIRQDDAALASTLESLLAQQAAVETAEFLEGSALGTPPLAALTGQTIGAYTLQHPLGEGGMGSVWLASRSDGRFEGQVAVKFLNLTLLARGGAERFAREGSMLARLSHPNIGRLLDAGVATGTAAGGQPYLVIEYIDGTPIDAYCDAHALGIAARLRLFLDVLAAVAHAHNNLILHRDLKPSNILVTRDGRVKLLDFGIGKLLAEHDVAGSATELTQLAGRAFTPDYAAPEQLKGEGVTTATDVYALGVLLYQLLVGKHPTALLTHTPVDRQRAVIESEPTRMSDAAARADALIARGRDTTVTKLERTLRGDLDNIVAKALKKVPDERYATASAFADDLRCHLSHEPVSARADSLGYRVGKFVRRHQVGASAAAAVALALVAGTTGTAWQAFEAQRQRDLALLQLTRAETASSFVGQMIVSTWGTDERITRNEFLLRSEELALRALKDQPEQQAVVLQSLGSFYGSLGDYRRAEPLMRRAIELLPQSIDRSWRAELECDHALTTWFVEKANSAKATLAHWAAQPGIEPEVAARCESYLAKVAQNTNDAQTALVHALNAQRRLREARRQDPLLQASVHGDLGFAYVLNGRGDEADREYEAALRIYRELDRQDSPGAIAILNNWSTASVGAGDVKRALQLFDEAIRLAGLRNVGADPPPYAAANRASALLALGRYDEAIDQADRAFGIAQRANHKTFQFSALLTQAGAHMERDELGLAAQRLTEAEVLARQLPADSPVAVIAGLRRARLAILRGDPKQARAAIQPAIEMFETRQMRGPVLSIALRMRAESAAQLGDRQAALRDGHASMQIAQQLQGGRRHSLLTGQSLLLVARVLLDDGDLPGSRAAARSAVEHLAAMLGDAHRDTLLARKLASG